MDFDKLISESSQEPLKKAPDRLTNIGRVLACGPEHADELCLRLALKAELSQRKMANSKKIVPLWRGPRDHDTRVFYGYAMAEPAILEAAI